MRLRLWSCVAWGVALLSVAQQLASWLGVHVLPPWIVFALSMPAYFVLRGLAAAATRRWQEGHAQQLINQITGRGDGE